MTTGIVRGGKVLLHRVRCFPLFGGCCCCCVVWVVDSTSGGTARWWPGGGGLRLANIGDCNFGGDAVGG